ncbi:MAG: hypothetical protein IPH29_10410 [Candidatus Microthrix sp.]|nr:hypothetical protein [Candidatus Microthrix sp.]
MRAHYGPGRPDTYTTIGDNPERTVPNPAKKAAAKHIRQAKTELAKAEAIEGRAHLSPGRTAAGNKIVADASTSNAPNSPTSKPLHGPSSSACSSPTSPPLPPRLNDNTKRIHDAIRMATHNAETALARLLAPHYTRQPRSPQRLHEIFTSPADIHTHNNQLHITIAPLSNPRRTRSTPSTLRRPHRHPNPLPGTNLTLTYTTKNL